ncbi:MAG: hypothetical protein R3F24_06365 [Gammaproteobacteria bacterium]
MNLRQFALGFSTGLATAAVTAAVATSVASNWINDLVYVQLPQSEIVRHPIDNGKYYLCWTDGVNRYGLAFRRTQLDAKIRSIPRAGRASVAALMAAPPVDRSPAIAPWKVSDEKVCWPK